MRPTGFPVFNALAQREEIDLHVIFLAESDPKLRDWLVYKDEIRFSYQVLPSWRYKFAGHNLLLNRGLKKGLRSAAPDAILCGGYNYLASWQALRWARQRRIPFMLWVESTERDIRSRKLVDRIPEKEIHEAVQRIRRTREVFVAVRYELWGARERHLYRAQCG